MAEHEPAAEAPNDPEPIAAGLLPEAPAAPALALTSRGGKLPPESAAYLKAQTELARLQMEHLHEQRSLQVEHLKHQEKHLRLRYFGDRLRIGLQLLGILGGLAVVSFLAAMAWTAHEDHGVAIEAFSVPPDLAQRGLTGQVAASELLDRLASMQAKTLTGRAASTYANDWGRDIKVEIPETGVSIGELNRYLREWLGSEERISGEIVRVPGGLALTARAGSNAGVTFEGPEADLDRLVSQAAEAIYSQTQPYRYAVYLASIGRSDEALRLYQRIAENGGREDRPWAYAGWAALLGGRGDFVGQRARALQALSFGLSDETGAIGLLNEADNFLSHWEDGLKDERLLIRAIRSGRTNPLGPSNFGRRTLEYRLGDYRAIVSHPFARNFATEGRPESSNALVMDILSLEKIHDVTGARRFAERVSPEQVTNYGLEGLIAQDTNGFATFTYDDWPRAERAIRTLLAASRGDFAARLLQSGLANAVSAQGRHAEAEALIARSPLDCDICVDARATIAAREGRWPAALHWISLLEARSPSIPFAPTEHGKLLLDRGEIDDAIAEFAKANRLSPHFADPLELWGEALAEKQDYPGAVAKFAAADKDAPRWGRNHLMWGEALMLTGRYAEARRQYQIASGLDLSRPDRAALDVLLERTARGPLHG